MRKGTRGISWSFQEHGNADMMMQRHFISRQGMINPQLLLLVDNMEQKGINLRVEWTSKASTVVRNSTMTMSLRRTESVTVALLLGAIRILREMLS